jgi:hypothetical protein
MSESSIHPKSFVCGSEHITSAVNAWVEHTEKGDRHPAKNAGPGIDADRRAGSQSPFSFAVCDAKENRARGRLRWPVETRRGGIRAAGGAFRQRSAPQPYIDLSTAAYSLKTPAPPKEASRPRHPLRARRWG